MPYDEHLADRVRKIFRDRHIRYDEKKMMGGLCFMVQDKMCVGVERDILMARIDPAFYEKALKKKGCREMDITGRPMRGFVLIDPIGIDMDEDLEAWVQLSLDYNPKARSSKKK